MPDDINRLCRIPGSYRVSPANPTRGTRRSTRGRTYRDCQRLVMGLEHIDDILGDIDQAMDRTNT